MIINNPNKLRIALRLEKLWYSMTKFGGYDGEEWEEYVNLLKISKFNNPDEVEFYLRQHDN